MKKILILLFVLCFSVGARADLFVVNQVEVSAVADSGVKAKEAALLQGGQIAFNRLLRRVALGVDPDALPVLAPEDISNFIADVVINEEQTTPTKYTGSLSFSFNEAAIKTFLQGQNISFLTQEPPVLMVWPIWKQDGVVQPMRVENPLYGAVQRLAGEPGLFELKVPDLSDERVTVLSDMGIQDWAVLKSIAKANQAAGVLVVFVESMGGFYQLSAHVIPAGLMMVSPIEMRVTGGGDAGVLMDRLLAQVNLQLADYWRAQQLQNKDMVSALELAVPVLDLNEWQHIYQALKTVAALDQMTVSAVKGKRVILSGVLEQSFDQLVRQLDQKGFGLTIGEGNEWVIYRKMPDIVPSTQQ